MKHLKTFLIAALTLVTAISFAACVTTPNTPDTDGNSGIVIGGDETQTSGSGDNAGRGNESETPDGGDKADTTSILVVYFSCTNTTKGRAEQLQAKLGSAIYEIVPAVPYTSADLNYSNSNSRSTKEQNDSTARPAINGSVENIDRYTTIYIGYPIWWGQAPKIIYTFLESYEFGSSVTIIPFCTSASSGMGTSGTNLHSLAPNANWKDGRRVASASDIDALENMK